MSEVIGGVGTSHVPVIGRTIHAGTQKEVSFSGFFESFESVHPWLSDARADVAIVIYNDHGLNFFLNNMPTFAIGAAHQYQNADEGWGEPKPRVFSGAAALSWRLAHALIEDEFDVSVCQEMVLDHAGVTALDLLWPDAPPPQIIPLVLNAVRPPLPTPMRCYKLGQAIGRAIRSFNDSQRVLLVASGGLSHELGQFGKINEAFDRFTIEQIVDGPEQLTKYSNDEIVDLAGAQGLELMTWLTMRGALEKTVDVVASVYHAPISHTGGAMLALDNRQRVARSL